MKLLYQILGKLTDILIKGGVSSSKNSGVTELQGKLLENYVKQQHHYWNQNWQTISC